MTLSEEISQEITESNKNRNAIRCRECNSLVLNPNTADFVTQTFSLPKQHQKNTVKIDELECEDFDHFWTVKDILAFENVGFLNTVDSKKYLICADCEKGPIGYQDLTTQNIYVAFNRIKHVQK
ncbi:guanine nucleotide exchange factor MSS4 homolog [Culicoides brevitarsis]|uniref:guanine nucleotide exchange factor MSS4 homolog n=1 Tax=Culicoides brevitarsis TaxID=469753 RepID=UPI00307C21C9